MKNIQTGKAKICHREDRRMIPGHRITLIIDDIPITTKYSQEISSVYHKPQLIKKILDKHNIHPLYIDHIDWDAIEAALRQMIKPRAYNLQSFYMSDSQPARSRTTLQVRM